MIPGFERIIEERIREAQQRGEFDALPGAGMPLVLEDDSHLPDDLRLAFKVLKNADCLPPEVELRREIERTEDLLAQMPETAEKYRVLRKLNFLVLKLNATRRTPILHEMPQRYLSEVAERMGRGRSKR